MNRIRLPKWVASVALATGLLLTTAGAFSDTEGHWAEGAINKWSQEYNIIQGYEDGTFRPDGEVMRSEFAVLVTRMLGVDESALKTFDGSCDDVDSTHWAVHYIGYCVDNGIMELKNNSYRPNDYITNKEAIWGLMRALGYTKLTSFTDVYNTAEEIGLFKKLEALNTDNKSSRIEVAQMIYNALNLNDVD